MTEFAQYVIVTIAGHIYWFRRLAIMVCAYSYKSSRMVGIIGGSVSKLKNRVAEIVKTSCNATEKTH